MEAGDWGHISMMYGHYIRCLPREVLVRILGQTSASIHGVNVAKIATLQTTDTGLIISTMQKFFLPGRLGHQ